jgi:hypothetical protein
MLARCIVDNQDWYSTQDIADLNADGVPLWLRISCESVAGHVAFTPGGNPRWRIGSLENWEKLPRGVHVDAWCPVDPANFPDVLPDPIRLVKSVEWKSPSAPHSEPESAETDYGWPHPHIRLGKPHEAPQSVEECEARILRFMRTRHHFERDRPIVAKAWPDELMQSAAVVDKMLASAPTRRLGFLREDDYADFHHDTSDKRPLPSRWEPTPRDCSEYDDGRVAGWIVSGSGQYFAWRAARPPFSFRQIAEILKCDEETARKFYKHQCERAFKKATG